MSGERLRTILVGFAGALLIFAVLFSVVGVDQLVHQLSNANVEFIGLVVAVTLGWLAAWSFALRTVLSVLGVDLSAIKSFFVFAGATFSNNITPFGQAGGEPVTALLISRTSDAEYETGLAAIASVDTLNFVPSITLALIGVGYFATETTLGRDLGIAAAAVVVLAVAIPSAVYLGWQRRYRLERRAIDSLAPFLGRLARRVPRLPEPDPASIERRIGRFFQSIERVATNPEGLALALALSSLGWLFQMAGLWLSFRAIGATIPLSIALFVVPMAAIAGVTPLPGGAGGIETVLVALLVATTGPAITEPIILAAVVIYRGSVYWTPTLIGGAVMGIVSLRGGS